MPWSEPHSRTVGGGNLSWARWELRGSPAKLATVVLISDLRWLDVETWGMLRTVDERNRSRRVEILATDDPLELPPPRLPAEADAGWAVAELFEVAWLASGRDPAELTRSPRKHRETRAR